MRETVIQIRCSSDEKETWRKLAEAKGVRLSEYVRELLNAMASRG
jgi:predicted DNA binding CopG/RHH family protein